MSEAGLAVTAASNYNAPQRGFPTAGCGASDASLLAVSKAKAMPLDALDTYLRLQLKRRGRLFQLIAYDSRFFERPRGI